MDEEKEIMISLYNYYGELFPEIARYNFEDYYFNNLSLGEIAENNNMSRAAVHKSIKKVENFLNYYEEKLGLYKKRLKLEKLIENMEDIKLRNNIYDLY